MPSSQMTRVSGVLILNSVPNIQISSQCKNPSNHHPNVNLEAKSTYPRIKNYSTYARASILANPSAHPPPLHSSYPSPQTRHAIPRRSNLIIDIRAVVFLNYVMSNLLNGRMTPIGRKRKIFLLIIFDAGFSLASILFGRFGRGR